MKSGWIINFKDGGQLFYSEEGYQDHVKTRNVNDIKSEEYWFDINDLIKKHPWVRKTP
ncbi:hypothetical protein [Alkalihalobacillus trypoxylicola]|uniref:hypothetical protein n=1 Tax=Alkalihalobacillus trypoxylicola TaxID=519424 RepID=UPI000A530517|nr:hypothetical protein [Alkalihalobacillus trypoxylicola]